MDERKAELNMLKKACRRVRRRATLGYRILFLLCLLLCLALVFLGLVVCLPASAITAYPCLSTAVSWGAQLCTWLGVPGTQLLPLVFVPAAAFAFLGLGCLVMWILGNRKVRKSDEFLSCRTLKETLRAEKKLKQ